MASRPKPAPESDWLETLPLAALLLDKKLNTAHANSLAGALALLKLDTVLESAHPLRLAIARAFGEGRSARIEAARWPRELAGVTTCWVSLCGPQVLLLIETTKGERAGEYTQLSSTMAAMLAHEIRNPLLAIRGAAQLLGETTRAEDAALPELIMREVARVEELIATLDPLSPAPAKNSTALNIHEPLERAREAAAAYAPQVRFVTDYDPSLPPVLGERSGLNQLALNLLRNAAEALADTRDPTVTIRTRYTSETRRNAAGTALPVAVTISDNGPGIAAEIAGHLFAPFATTKPNGRGLGLAVAARITEAHGGLIGARNGAEGGAAFTLYLPIG